MAALGRLSEALRRPSCPDPLTPLAQPASTACALDSYASGKVLAEYIWVSGNAALQSRTVVLEAAPGSVEDLPVAEVDGSYTGQASFEHCELYLRPRKVFPDPLRGGSHVLVLCDTYVPQFDGDNPMPQLQAHSANTRIACDEVMVQAAEQAPMFAAQQEYSVLDPGTGLPCGAQPIPCAPKQLWTPHAGGVAHAVSRTVSELHMSACLSAGLRFSGTQQVAAPGAWVYKLGPCAGGVELGDQLWASRHLLLRIGERQGVHVSFEPRQEWGAGGPCGCSLEFSTQASRTPGTGVVAMRQHIMRLQAHHAEHCSAYSTGSPSLLALLAGSPDTHAGTLRRHIGAHHHHAQHSGASGASTFTCGVGNKRASVMIPSSTLLNKCGPIVDRRPPSNMDPYLSTMLLAAAALDLPLPESSARSLQQSSSSPARTCSYTGYSGGGSASRCTAASLSDACRSSCETGNSEDLLISELYRRDQFAPNTPPGCDGGMGLGDDAEGTGETRSDGTSPVTHGPLAGTCKDDDMAEFYE